MVIAHNLQASNSLRQLNINTDKQAKSTEKLSSGLRINRAADDAAGLSISEKMRGQISGLNQASTNAQDGISLIQTAEGALDETHSILQRMRELAVQGANGTLEKEDQTAIQQEIDQLSEEIDRISTDTQFNKKDLLNGSTKSVTLQVGANEGQTITVDMEAMSAKDLGVSKLVIAPEFKAEEKDANVKLAGVSEVSVKSSKTLKDEATFKVKESITYDNSGNATSAKYSVDDAEEVTVTDFTKESIDVEDKNGNVYTIKLKQPEQNTAAASSTKDTTKEYEVSDPLAAAEKTTEIGDPTQLVGVSEVKLTSGELQDSSKLVIKQDIAVDTGNNNAFKEVVFNVGGKDNTFAAADIQGQTALEVEDNNGNKYELTISETDITGANAGTKTDKLAVSVTGEEDSTEAVNGAGSCITAIDKAIEKVSAFRSNLGAYQNRLEHTIKNLDNASENLQTAESRIRDTDMAEEMMSYTSANVLSQAAQSMLAQANQSPSQVLSLLQ